MSFPSGASLRRPTPTSFPRGDKGEKPSEERALLRKFVAKNRRTEDQNLKMAELKAAREKLAIERRKVGGALKSESRKRQRLKAKARKRTAEELVEVSICVQKLQISRLRRHLRSVRNPAPQQRRSNRR